jgi:hypothetical protein
MSEDWRLDFRQFLADMGECPPGLTLDRIDVNGDYSPANCRWIGNRAQAGNKRNTVWVEHNGEPVCFAEYARRHGVNYESALWRVRQKGETPQKAVLHLVNRSRTSFTPLAL